MADASLIKSSNAVTFMVSAGLVYEIIAAACSSPQTAEINARKRSATLMKWVKIGLLQAAFFVLIAAYLDDETWPSIVGGSLAAVIMWLSYVYANRSGLASDQPGTETY
jgi:hypothetical protein